MDITATSAAVGVAVNRELERVPAKRWFAIRRALDMTVDQITEDSTACLVVAAAQQHFRDEGRDNWDRILDMTYPELVAYLVPDAQEAYVTEAEVTQAIEADAKSED